jgi:hypothetical protein
VSRYFTLPTALARKEMHRRELARLRKAKERYSRPRGDRTAEYAKRNVKRKTVRHEQTQCDLLSRQFIMWDGESPQDSGYSLFGNSAGYEICHPYLSTTECLELIYDTELDHPDAIHIGFGFNLDVSYILKDLPRRNLTALHVYGKTVWKEWEIEHIPHKWFRVKRGNVDAKIFDIHSFFASSYVGSLQKFNVGTPQELASLAQEKARRSEFLWKDIADIKQYWQLELKLGPELGNALRHALFLGANYVPRSWHGPGAIARMALKRHGVYDAMAESPYDVRLATRYAFAGGRFEPFLVGHSQGIVYEADLNSAYPYYATMLPNLAKGKWRRTKYFEPGKFGVYHIDYHARPEPTRVYPLFRRMKDNSICWPHRVEGWYWAPEAELVANDSDATFIEGWIFDEDNPADRPFAFLAEYYRNRKAADRSGSIAAYTFKIIINAIFGQLAQRSGWDRKRKKAPRSHQLEWAGYITSACRAAVYRAAIQCGEKLISINTDSVQALCPLDFLDCGNNLGQWKISEYEDGIFWQSGIYSLRESLDYPESLGYGWSKAKTRGIPKGSYTPEQLLECLKNDQPLRLNKKIFVTYGLADNGRWEELNTWNIEPHEFIMGGSGKRRHNIGPKGRFCEKHCTSLHRLTMWLGPYVHGDPMSKIHYLPWLDPPDDVKNLMDDLMLFDADHLDYDQEWVREYEYV